MYYSMQLFHLLRVDCVVFYWVVDVLDYIDNWYNQDFLHELEIADQFRQLSLISLRNSIGSPIVLIILS